MRSNSANGHIVIAGGSGFLGVSLARHLADAGWPVVLLSRQQPKLAGPWRHAGWDARTPGPWQHELEGAAALVNLVGRSVDCRKTPEHCDEILRSRVEATAVLGEAVRSVDNPPPVWVQMSTAHIYGDPPQAVCSEDSAYGYGLAPDVGRAWEAAFQAASLPDQRCVVLRTSFVIGRPSAAGGGALARLSLLARLGLGGRVGSGRQGMSWLHQFDFNRIVERAIGDPSFEGVYIASTPHPLSQRDFMRTLRRAVGMPLGLPAPEWLVRLGARFVLDTDPELALYGRYVIPRRLLDAGFEFRFPRLDAALADLLAAGGRERLEDFAGRPLPQAASQ